MGGTTGLRSLAQEITKAQQEESDRQAARETAFSERARETSFPGFARDDLVTSAYRDILGRNPEPAGLQHSTNAMISGMTGGDLVRGFIGSPEFQQAQDYQRAFTKAFRPGYEQFGPNQQFYPSIYRPGYTDYGIEGAVNFPRPAYGYNENLYQSRPLNPDVISNSINKILDGESDESYFGAIEFASPGLTSGFKQGGQVDDGIASLLKK